MQIRKERVAVAKKVETVSVKKVPIVETLVDDDSQGLTPGQLDKILPQFAHLVASASESEAITRSRLHELLHQSIDVLEEDGFSFVEDEGQADPEGRSTAAYVGVCLHGSESHYPSDLVYMNFEAVDVEKSPHVFALLDEGCNSTCHSNAWAADAEKKLARLGYTMPLKDDGGKSFAGLGSGSTKTEGVRSIPFSLVLKTDHVNGVLESHQLSSGHSLQMLQNRFANGLTKGLFPLTPGVPAEIPKARRPLRAMAATVSADVSGHSIVGFHNKEQYSVDKALKRACESSAAVVLVTRGKRFGTIPSDPCGRRRIVVDVERLDDPERDRQMCIHVGWAPGISRTLTRLLGFNKVMAEIASAATECDNPRGILVEIRRKSGRHRSVCAGFCALRHFRRHGHMVELVHLQSPDWTTMKCGGTCSACRDYAKCLSAIEGILPPRHDGPIRAPGRPQAKVRPKPCRRCLLMFEMLPAEMILEMMMSWSTLEGRPVVLQETLWVIIKEEIYITWKSQIIVKEEIFFAWPSPRDDFSAPFREPSETSETTSKSTAKATPSIPRRRPRSERTSIFEIGSNGQPDPKEPPTSPPLHRQHGAVATDRVELEGLLRQNLAQDEKFSGPTARPDLVDGEILNAVIDLSIREGNRDRLYWICDPDLGASQQQSSGVRVSCLIRSHIRGGQLAKVPSLCRGWLRTVWCRSRGSADPWTLLDNRVPNGQNVQLDTAWVDVVVFHHHQPPLDGDVRRAYMSAHVVGTKGIQKPRDVRDVFEKSLNPFNKKMYAVKSKAKPHGNFPVCRALKTDSTNSTPAPEKHSLLSSFPGAEGVKFVEAHSEGKPTKQEVKQNLVILLTTMIQTTLVSMRQHQKIPHLLQ
eukprot:s1209_g10.t1